MSVMARFHAFRHPANLTESESCQKDVDDEPVMRSKKTLLPIQVCKA